MYGISEDDIKEIDSKIDFQKKYLKNFSIDIGDKFVNMLDSSYSANLNPNKYFAEINNRVNTLVNNAKDQGLKPVFITITAPSKYHIKDNRGNLLYSPNETAKELTQIFNKFTRLNIFEVMKKTLGHGLVYFRVYEPHKSGVPHLHAMLFIPANYILPIKKKFYEYFSDKLKFGTNKKALDYRYTWYKQKGGAVGYIMKYILKSFEDINSNKKQLTSYWYIKNGVRRFLSSRSLVPLSVYRKVRYYFKEHFGIDDLKIITNLFQSGQIRRHFNNTLITYIYMCPNDGLKELILWSKDGDLLKNSKTYTSQRIELNYQSKKKYDTKEVDYSGLNRYIPNRSNSFNGTFIIPSKLSNFQLNMYYHKLLDFIDRIDHNHFLITQKEMQKRDLLEVA